MSLPQKISDIVQIIIKARQQVVANYLVIGKVLKLAQKDDLWRNYGEHLETFEDFLKEIHIKRSTAYHCMAVYEEFGKYLSNGLDVPFRRLIKLLPVAKTNKEEWLAKAKTLTETDFNREVLEAKGVPEDCECKNLSYFSYCPNCRKWQKLSDEDLKKICKKI